MSGSADKVRQAANTGSLRSALLWRKSSQRRSSKGLSLREFTIIRKR